MESNNLTNRTYTTPTCALTVSCKGQSSSREDLVDFKLQLEHPDRDELDRTLLQGTPAQLDCLQQVVSKYIADLVAKFPLPDRATQQQSEVATSTPERERPTTPAATDKPKTRRPIESARAGIIKNLPGLRSTLPSYNEPTDEEPTEPDRSSSHVFSKSGIAQLLGRWGKQPQPPVPEVAVSIDAESAPTARNQEEKRVTGAAAQSDRSADLPYLVGVGDRALDHQLHLGNISTTSTERVLTLSAIELFDLATVLEEYNNEYAAKPQAVAGESIFNRHRAANATDPTGTRLRLPNVPPMPAASELDRAYYRNRNSQPSSFMSAVPWAIGAAALISIPVLLLDRHSNPLKDLVAKFDVPGLMGAKKTTTATKPATAPTTTLSTTNLPTPTPAASTPAQWQTQPVTPPVIPTTPTTTGTTTTGTTGLGTSTLPGSIGGGTGNLPSSTLGTTPAGSNTSSILSGSTPSSILSGNNPAGSMGNMGNISGTPKPATTKDIDGLKPANKTAIATKSTTPAQTADRVGSLPIDGSVNPGKLSVSKSNTKFPAAPIPPSANEPPTTPVPFSPLPLDASDASSEPAAKPTAAKKAAKPKAAISKPASKTAKSTTAPNTQPTIEPFTPVIRNPNLIDPNPAPNTPQSTAPDPQSQASNNIPTGGTEPTANISLGETKRYFQNKWKADATQPNSLQYVIQVAGKSGIVRSIDPQGEAASSYLQESKLIKPGQKLLSPTAAGSTDQKIRVLLQPDGNVETFIEP